MNRNRRSIMFFTLLFFLPAIASIAGCRNETSENAKSPVPTATPLAMTATTATPAPAATPNPSAEMKTGPSGLQYQDLVVGVGPKPFLGQTLLIAYVGKLKDGATFDKGTFDFKPGKDSVIKGWNLGILGGKGVEPMRVGGKRKLIVPPELGYGANIMGTIPANSTLYFEVELLRATSSSGLGSQ